MSTQPALPDPLPYTPIEESYIRDSPSGLWPDNQDSNFGTHRKIFCDQLMVAMNQLQLIYNEHFPDTSEQFIEQWESEVGLPVNSPGKTLLQRQSAVKQRLSRGAFTRTLRKNIVEAYVTATFGIPAIAFSTQGLSLQSGIRLGSGVGGTATDYYNIVENVENFSYTVNIAAILGADLEGLNRELQRVTPAGISFSIVTY